MISLETACAKAVSLTGWRYVIGAYEAESGYVIVTSLSDEEPDTSPLIIDKNTGGIDVFFFPDHQREKIKRVDIPEQFRWNAGKR